MATSVIWMSGLAWWMNDGVGDDSLGKGEICWQH